MAQLFISYHYTAQQSGQVYQGFGSMIRGPLVFGEPSEERHIEALENDTAKHCRDSLGMETATTTILWWRRLKP